MDARIDLVADLNDEDDEGLGWSTLSEASDPARIRPGLMVVAVDDDGQVHFAVLPGPVAKNSHLIGRALA